MGKLSSEALLCKVSSESPVIIILMYVCMYIVLDVCGSNLTSPHPQPIYQKSVFVSLLIILRMICLVVTYCHSSRNLMT